MSDDGANHPAFIGYCRTCEGMTACTVAEPDRKNEVAKFCGAIIRRGDRLESSTVGTARKAPFCKCPSRRKRKAAAPHPELELSGSHEAGAP